MHYNDTDGKKRDVVEFIKVLWNISIKKVYSHFMGHF